MAKFVRIGDRWFNPERVDAAQRNSDALVHMWVGSSDTSWTLKPGITLSDVIASLESGESVGTAASGGESDGAA